MIIMAEDETTVQVRVFFQTLARKIIARCCSFPSQRAFDYYSPFPDPMDFFFLDFFFLFRSKAYHSSIRPVQARSSSTVVAPMPHCCGW